MKEFSIGFENLYGIIVNLCVCKVGIGWGWWGLGGRYLVISSLL